MVIYKQTTKMYSRNFPHLFLQFTIQFHYSFVHPFIHLETLQLLQQNWMWYLWFLLYYSKCHKYSPSEPTKAYDKNVSRKSGLVFKPEQVLDYVAEPDRVRTREELAENYCDVCVGELYSFHVARLLGCHKSFSFLWIFGGCALSSSGLWYSLTEEGN